MITEFIKKQLLILDGGMGTLLQENGLSAGELPERLNLTNPSLIKKIHLDYFKSGSNTVSANTFGANCLKFSDSELEEIIASALSVAKEAKAEAGGTNRWVALDIGPTGRLLAPYGDLDFEDAVEIFAKTVRLGVKHGADFILIETMSDSYETKAALLAAKENSSLPVFVFNAYSDDGKLLTGASPAAMVALLEGMGADAIGINCSRGPMAMQEIVNEYLKYASVPVLFKPNAGLPQVKNGKTVFDISPEDFANQCKEALIGGIRGIGGCCGTTPDYISAVCKKASELSIPDFDGKIKPITSVSSHTHAVAFENRTVLVGERINPTGKKRFKEALIANDIDYILNEAIAQADAGAQILDVNVGLPEIDEISMLTKAVNEIQAVCGLPLQLDTSNPKAMEAALRRYNGKAMINSVNGKQESMDAIFPLVKKYGGLVVALTLDENGIPETAAGRVRIAEKILAEAQKHGIHKRDIIFDPLAMTVSADQGSALTVLSAIEQIKHGLCVHTSLGVSNISFGLPRRDIVTSAFFTLAMAKGLSCAIMNPYSEEMLKAYHAYNTLSALDPNCSDYISFASSLTEAQPSQQPTPKKAEAKENGNASPLFLAIGRGLREQASSLTKELLKTEEPLAVVEKEVIPALNFVGSEYESKRAYLPQLLMSAEAAKAAFEEIKARLPEGSSNGFVCVLATVKGDIHDIGKNIVKLLLQNYGFDVIDLGRDVAPREIADTVIKLHAPLAGLSALMTTTVPAMEETIAVLHAEAPWCKTVVGGAVLTEDYAKRIGADRYSADAMETVRYAEELKNSKNR